MITDISIFNDKTNIVFDFDMTIAKLEIDWTNWHEEIAKVYDLFNKDHGYYRGLNPHDFYNVMVVKYGHELVSEVRKFNSKYEEQYVVGFAPANDLINLIKSLKNKNLYIFTSNSRKTILKGLNELKINTLFKQIISRDETNFLKPNPEGFFLIENFNDSKDSFLMVGDSLSDEQAAKNAGISFYKWTEFETYKY